MPFGVTISSFPFLNGKYLFYREYTALFGSLIFLFFYFLSSVVQKIFSKIIKVNNLIPIAETTKEKSLKEDDSDRLLDPNISPRSIEYNYRQGNTSRKELIIIKFFFFLQFLKALLICAILTTLSSFNIIPLWISLLSISIILYLRIRNIGLKSGAFRIVSAPFSFLTVWSVIGMVCLIPILTHKSCLIDHVDSPLRLPGGFSYSSAALRYLLLDKACPVGPPCHAYITLPYNASSEIFFNMHTDVDTTQAMIFFDEREYLEQNERFRFSSETEIIIPSDIDSTGARVIHSALLSNLKSYTDYVISVHYNGNFQKNYSYRSLPDGNFEQSYNIIYGGDVGHSELSIKMAKVVAKHDPLALFIGGDNAYDNGDSSCYHAMDLFLWTLERNIFNPLERIVPIVLAIGNHDIGINSDSSRQIRIDENGPSHFAYFPQNLPQNNTQRVPLLRERTSYSAHLIGSIVNFVLDTDYVSEHAIQEHWMMNIINHARGLSKVAIYHNPIYSPCSYFTETGPGPKSWASFFEENQFLISFENHVHSFKKSFPIRNNTKDIEKGIIYIGDGCWGVQPGNCKNPDFSSGLIKEYKNVNNVILISFNHRLRKANIEVLGILDEEIIPNFSLNLQSNMYKYFLILSFTPYFHQLISLKHNKINHRENKIYLIFGRMEK